jgi:predicted nucleic acid-binding protein
VTTSNCWSSAYAIEEARRNLAMDRPEAVPRLERLLESVATVDVPHGLKLPQTIQLEPKDQPVLLAAIHGKADYLLTGDARHFEHLSGKRIEDVLVLRPAAYFECRRRV